MDRTTFQAIFQSELFFWAVGLIIGLTLVQITLSEVIDYLQRRNNPLAQGVRRVRNVVVPLLALFLLLRQVVGLADSIGTIRILETLFWLTVIYAGLTLLGNVTRLGELNPASWVTKIPVLFFALGRALVVLVVIYYVLSGVWHVDISSFFTAVGVGALAISFALQDTLSNLVSGFLLLIDRPFQVGDTVSINGGPALTVEEVNWRAVRFRSVSDWSLNVIPNGTLGRATIANYGDNDTFTRVRFIMRFSHRDPPNLVKQMLVDVLNRADGVVLSRPRRAILINYGESALEYRVEFVTTYGALAPVTEGVRTRIYYAARRHGFTIPVPMQTIHVLDEEAAQEPDPHTQILGTLRSAPLFLALPQETIQWLVANARLHHYGNGECIVQQGEPDEGFYVVCNGDVRLLVMGHDGSTRTIAHLAHGDTFGEMVLLRNALSPVTVQAASDAEVIVIELVVINQLIEQNHRFAMAMNTLTEERKRAIAAITGIQTEDEARRRQNGQDLMDLIRSA